MNRRAHYRTNVQGESLEERLRDLISSLYEVLMFPAFWAIIVVYYWLIALGVITVGVAPAFFLTIVLLIISVRAARKYLVIKKDIYRCRKGLEGEILIM